MTKSFSLNDFNAFMMEECIKVSKESNCKRRKVGAILVGNPLIMASYYDGGFEEIDYKDAIISKGTNKCLKLDESCEEQDCLIINGHCERTIHAEVNCVTNPVIICTQNKWLYITTAPCIKCFQFLVLKGIKTIWYGDDSYWKINPKYGEYIMSMAEKYGMKLGKVE